MLVCSDSEATHHLQNAGVTFFSRMRIVSVPLGWDEPSCFARVSSVGVVHKSPRKKGNLLEPTAQYIDVVRLELLKTGHALPKPQFLR